MVNVEERLRALVRAEGGRISADRAVQEALGVAGARGPLARKLVEGALSGMRGLVLEGDTVVERAGVPRTDGRVHALVLAPSASPTVLPPFAVACAVPATATPTVHALSGAAWRAGVADLALELSGAVVLALSAASARRVLRLGAQVAGLDPDDEPEVVALGRVARALGRPITSAEEAAALVGAAVPETPEASVLVLADLAAHLAELAGVAPGGLGEVADRDVAPEFEFGDRGFGRAEILALPEAPGVYLFEGEEGEVLYVGKSDNLRRRVGSYFAPTADDRASRIREQAFGLSHERTGTELTALLREHELIRDLQPALNVQEKVHERGRAPEGRWGDRATIAIVQPSADGGVEVLVLDRERGAAALSVVPDGPSAEARCAVEALLGELARRPRGQGAVPEVEIALSWLSTRGASASVVDASGSPSEVAALLLRLAADPDLADGRIIPVR